MMQSLVPTGNSMSRCLSSAGARPTKKTGRLIQPWFAAATFPFKQRIRQACRVGHCLLRHGLAKIGMFRFEATEYVGQVYEFMTKSSFSKWTWMLFTWSHRKFSISTRSLYSWERHFPPDSHRTLVYNGSSTCHAPISSVTTWNNRWFGAVVR